jgi:hypothetical protein
VRIDEKPFATQGFVYFNATEPVEVEPVVMTGDEADLKQAVQILFDAGLILERDAKKYINPPMHKTLRQRLRAWRERNAR